MPTHPTIVIGLVMMTALATAAPAAAGNDSCAGGFDAGDSWQFAYTTNASRNCTGSLDNNDDEDWYAVPVSLTTLNGRLNVEVCPSGSWDPDLRVYFQDAVDAVLVSQGSYKAGSAQGTGACDEVSVTENLDAAGGRWLIQVYQYSGSGSYTLRIQA